MKNHYNNLEVKKPDVIVVYSWNEFGDIHISIDYDEKLSIQRKKSEKENETLFIILFSFFYVIC